MSWSDDLSRSKAPRITNLADKTLSKAAARDAAGLLGYAAAAFYYVRSAAYRLALATNVWTRQNPHTERSYGAHIRIIDAKLDALAESMGDEVARACRTAAAEVTAQDVADQLKIVPKENEEN